VIRGEEHLSNTPYQLMLIDALGYRRPRAFAHMPLILAKDGSKMSKRKHPELNLAIYREQGYLPEALINYLALLGWNPGTEQELFTFDELVKVFAFDRVQHAGARFDWEKLNWINGEYIRRLSLDELTERLRPFVPQLDEATILRAAPALQTRLHKLAEAVDYLEFLWSDPPAPSFEAETAQRVQMAIEAVRDLRWEPEAIEAALEKAVADSGVGKGKFYTPLRDALTGKKVALPIHYCFALLPKEVALQRLQRAINVPA
jgi:glutamyl/glutaminyl-tRNA synthetase